MSRILLHRTVLFCGLLFFCGAVLAQKDKVETGYGIGNDGRLFIADSLLPGYYLEYASAGAFRKSLPLPASAFESVGYLVSIPVLVGRGISREKSEALFRRSLVFNMTGLDPEGAYAGSGQGNIYLPPNVIAKVGKDFSGASKLYADQIKLGNVLVVDDALFFPLMISSGAYAREFKVNQEHAAYYQAIFAWAAAYPWYFYALPNVALKQALASKNQDLVGLFGNHRFILHPNLYDELMQAELLQKFIY